MFPAAKPKVVEKPKRRPKVRESKKEVETTKELIRKVDPFHITVKPEWMADYWSQEALWDYYIPEDNQIKFNEGQYVVPIVVFRHYEDMLNTKPRADVR